jgi:hypothetical protein
MLVEEHTTAANRSSNIEEDAKVTGLVEILVRQRRRVGEPHGAAPANGRGRDDGFVGRRSIDGNISIRQRRPRPISSH